MTVLGSRPVFAANYFCSLNVGPIYGFMLTPWGKIAVIVAASTILTILISPSRVRGESKQIPKAA